jgi:antitoxin component YwqK of YwqJK toxin-antitoxin module
MRFILTVIFVITINFFSFSQYSEGFKLLTENLTAIDTLNFEDRYKNGEMKEKGTVLIYKVGDYSADYYYGSYYQYFRNGKVKMEAEFDRFGNLLFQKCYFNFGGLCSESTTLLIDSKTKDLEALLREDKNTKVTSHDKFYSYSMKLDSVYLKKEGKMIGNKKIGVWKIYSRTGGLINEREY